ncbi:MAG: UDP-N-acetylmuramoyl-L-alanine--D-glutamate ligase [Nitrospinae bacterium]|nr:UDP-N-acetylmuramoyl-L-alanine--D-glutamate ligase [Nitrospinota bacterium]
MDDYKGKKALVIGLARSGVAAASLLASRGAAVTVTDMKKAEDLGEFSMALPSSVAQKLGGHEGIGPEGFDLAVISPGVPWDAPFPAAVRRAGVEMISEMELGSRHIGAPMIAITGANGKTTTTTLAGRMMEAAGKRTFVGGNIGAPLCGAAGKDYDWIVAEVSSFQMEGVKTFRPKVSAVLNVTPDHMDRHKTMQAYAALKAAIFKNQGEGDTVILNAEDGVTLSFNPPAGAQTLWFGHACHGWQGAWIENGAAVADMGAGKIKLFDLADLKVPGSHNVENALAASLAALAAGASPHAVAEVIKGFTGLPHRMEIVDVVNGVTFINDSKGTNTDASIKSLSGYFKNVVIIAGGSSKGADFGAFADTIRRHAKGAVLIGKTAPQIQSALGGFSPAQRASDMREAVRAAAAMCAEGDTVLLSPACASFDMFNNYEHRGDVFRAAVAELSTEAAQCR